MLNPDKIEEKVLAFANHLENMHAANDWKEVVRKTAGMMNGLGSGKRLTSEDLKQIQHQVLINIGSKDHMVTIDESTEATKNLPNDATLRTLEDFKYPIEKVDSKVLSTIIKEFLNQ